MKRNIFMLFAVILVAGGCIKDNTTKEFATLDLPVIDNPDNLPELFVENYVYSVKGGDVLEIKPAVSYSDMDDLEYQWKINGKVVSTEKDLKWTCDISELSAGAFYMTRKSAGNSVILKFTVDLDQPYERGWVIVTEKSGKVVYNFLQEKVAAKYVYTEYPDALATESTSDSWLMCKEFWSNESSSVKGHMLHLDADPEKSFSVNELTMVPTVTLRQEFIAEEFPADTRFTDAVYGGYVAYLLGDNGKVYYRKAQTGYYTGRFSNIPLRFDGKELTVSHLVGTTYHAKFLLMYDSVNKRFLSVNTAFGANNSSAGEISVLPASSLDNLGNVDFLYSMIIRPQMTSLPDYRLFMVLKDTDSQEVTVSEYQLEISDGNVLAVEELYSGVKVPGLGENSHIIALDNSTYGSSFVYFSDSADPSVLHFAKRQASGISEVGKYYDFDSGIVALGQAKMSRTNKSIGVAFDDNSFSVLNVTSNMEEYVPPVGDEPNSLAYRWENVGGKILDAEFRFGNIGQTM